MTLVPAVGAERRSHGQRERERDRDRQRQRVREKRFNKLKESNREGQGHSQRDILRETF